MNFDPKEPMLHAHCQHCSWETAGQSRASVHQRIEAHQKHPGVGQENIRHDVWVVELDLTPIDSWRVENGRKVR